MLVLLTSAPEAGRSPAEETESMTVLWTMSESDNAGESKQRASQ